MLMRWIVCWLGIHFLGPGANVLPTAWHRFRGKPLAEYCCLRCGEWVWGVDIEWHGTTFDRTDETASDDE